MKATLGDTIEIEPALDGFRDGPPVPIKRGNANVLFWNGNRPGDSIYDVNGTLLYRSNQFSLASTWEEIQSERRLEIEWRNTRGWQVRPWRAIHPWYDGYETPTLTSIVFAWWQDNDLYALVQTEDVHQDKDVQGGAYGRVGLAVSDNGFDQFRFLKLDEQEQYGPSWSPILESYQPQEEALPDDPLSDFFGMAGVTVSTATIKDGYLYGFYNRFVNTTRYNHELRGYPGWGFPPHLSRLVPPCEDTPNNQTAEWAFKQYSIANYDGICLFRMNLDTFNVEKYYENRVGGESEWTGIGWRWKTEPVIDAQWTEPFRGLSTKLILDGAYPHIHWNKTLQKYIMVCQGDAPFPAIEYVPKIIWYTSDDLVNWDYHGVLFEWEHKCFYPVVCNSEGTDSTEIGDEGILVWCSPVDGKWSNRGCKTRIRFL